jgi:hypothetical protein
MWRAAWAPSGTTAVADSEVSMNVGIVPSKILSGRFRPGKIQSTTSPPAGLRPLSPEQEAQA